MKRCDGEPGLDLGSDGWNHRDGTQDPDLQVVSEMIVISIC